MISYEQRIAENRWPWANKDGEGHDGNAWKGRGGTGRAGACTDLMDRACERKGNA